MRKAISNWILKYAQEAGQRALVIGVSGGIDSALTSTLCAETGIQTHAISMPIHQEEGQLRRARRHQGWLTERYSNVVPLTIDLTAAFDAFRGSFAPQGESPLALANSRSRLRMTALYHVAIQCNGLVVGTGNKIEDFGVGFFTKYGDGGVDLSPIGDLMKSEVYAMARDFGIIEDILQAPPTDGLFDDNRTDEEQLGASYAELEWAMSYEFLPLAARPAPSAREEAVLAIYRRLHAAARHKLIPIPVFLKS